jgi:hypothetical protein
MGVKRIVRYTSRTSGNPSISLTKPRLVARGLCISCRKSWSYGEVTQLSPTDLSPTLSQGIQDSRAVRSRSMMGRLFTPSRF